MKNIKNIAGLFLSAMLLAGCSPSGPSATTAAGTAASETTASETTASDTAVPGGSTTTAGSTAELEAVTFLLDWTPNTNHTGLYVALEKGWFAEEGLAVDIQTPPQGGSASLVAAGRADFGIDAQDTMAPAFTSESPLPVTAIAAIVDHNTSGIISRKGEGMASPGGLEGKKYATWDNPVEQAIIRNVVEKDGGDYSKVQLIPNNITDEVAALRTGQVDAVWIFYGWSGINAEIQGFAADYFHFRDINPVFDYYTPIIVTSDRLIEESPETVASFMRGAARGYEYAAEHPEEAAEILLKHAPELDPELTLASQRWLSEEYAEAGKPWGLIDAARWDGFYAWLWENSLIEQEIPVGKGFTNEFNPGQ